MTYEFGPYTLDPERYELARGSEVVPTEPQVFALLEFLIKNHDRVVSKDEVIEAIWDGRIVSDATLSSRISAARQAVGDLRLPANRYPNRFTARVSIHRTDRWSNSVFAR